MTAMTTTKLNARVCSMRWEAAHILSVELQPADNLTCFPEAEAGAHIDLQLGNGLIRSYSLINPGENHRYVVAVLNDANSRGGSRFVHEKLRVGDVIEIGSPRNHFRLDENAANSVLLAGGIGVTPLLAMFKRLVLLGKTARFIYCGRSRAGAAFIDEIKKIEEMAPTGSVSTEFIFDDEQGGPPDIASLLTGNSATTHFYCCGPTSMLDSFEAATQRLGYTNVHIERFKVALMEEVTSKSGYTVELRRAKKTFEVAPGMSLLAALQSQGVSPALSCQEGLCGTCETKVIAGEVVHRDSILTAAERAANKSMMVCVSSGRCGHLVLDL